MAIFAAASAVSAATGGNRKKNPWKKIRKNWVLYLFILPSILYITIFNYAPLYGIQIAFRDFKAASGIWGSAWGG